jgi:signal transduction histidine kinase
MEPKLAKENSFSSYFLIIAIFITITLLSVIVFKNYLSNKKNALSVGRDFETIKLKENIIYLDEVLTMTARISAETGNTNWEKRYRSYVVELDNTLNKIQQNIPSALLEEFVMSTDVANDKLVEMENKVFRFIHINRLDSARLVLRSKEYEKQKTIYKAGMDQLAFRLDIFIKERQNAMNKSFYSELWIMGFIISILLIGWFFVFQFQNRAKKHLMNYIQLKDSLYDEIEKKAMALAIANQKLKKAEEKLIDINKDLESFSYSISHDLRAPLRAIKSYAQIFSEDYGGKLDPEGIRLLETIQYNALKMEKLIDDLLALSHLGRKEILKTEVDMNILTQNVINDINTTITHKAEINTSMLHTVKADYNLLYQVMTNLVSNAIKYSSKAENPVVRISSEEKNGEIIYTVNDNGAGFDMEYADKLFGVFQRLHSQEEFEGTGVGLAIVQRIISKHGGKVWAKGIVNEGAVFTFTLEKN